MRILLLAAGLALAAGLVSPAASAAEAGRYELRQSDGGFIRLDTMTGSVSECRQKGTGWVCESVADDRKAFQDEIARLDEENRKLKARIAGLEDKLASRDPKTRQGSDYLRLPSDEEIDKLMGFFEKIMRRFMDFARSLDGSNGQET